MVRGSTVLLEIHLKFLAASHLLILCSFKDTRFEVGRCGSNFVTNTQCSPYRSSPYRGVRSALLGLLTTMPRQQRSAFEVAVAASPLFKLALEIRVMIYGLLLIQEGSMFIPSDIFSRRDYGRIGPTPYECILCGLVFVSHEGCSQHVRRHYTPYFVPGHIRPARPLLPRVSTSLLYTCRIIRFEASPILYSRNSFHFSDPATASNFRWRTDCAQAGAIQEIGIKFGSIHYKQVSPWVTYVTKQTLSLGQDFPHLRHVTFDLNVWLGVESATLLRSMSERLRERVQGLDWVLVLMLSNEKVLDCFEPLVDRRDDSDNARKEVRRHAWANPKGLPWKNGLLWWGSPGEAVPHKYRMIGDQPTQYVSSEGTDEGISMQCCRTR